MFPEWQRQGKSGINTIQNSELQIIHYRLDYISAWFPQLVARQPLSGDKPLFDILEISNYFISFHIKTAVRTAQARGLGILEKADLIPPRLFFLFSFFF